MHAFVVGRVTERADDPVSPTVAPEFVVTSVSSNPRPQRLMDAWQRENPNLALCAGEKRGYLRMRLTDSSLQADLVALDDARDPQSGRYLLRTYTVEAGRPDILG